MNAASTSAAPSVTPAPGLIIPASGPTTSVPPSDGPQAPPSPVSAPQSTAAAVDTPLLDSDNASTNTRVVVLKYRKGHFHNLDNGWILVKRTLTQRERDVQTFLEDGNANKGVALLSDEASFHLRLKDLVHRTSGERDAALRLEDVDVEVLHRQIGTRLFDDWAPYTLSWRTKCLGLSSVVDASD
jgi:hypothetical protein